MRNFDRDILASKIADAMHNLQGKRNASTKLVQGIYFMVNPSQKEPSLRKAAKIGNRLVKLNSAHEHKPLVRRKRIEGGFMFIGFKKPTKSVTIDVISSALPKKERSNSLPLTAGQNYKVVIRDRITGKPLGKLKERFLNGSNR